jgi:hypothetical protein
MRIIGIRNIVQTSKASVDREETASLNLSGTTIGKNADRRERREMAPAGRLRERPETGRSRKFELRRHDRLLQ